MLIAGGPHRGAAGRRRGLAVAHVPPVTSACLDALRNSERNLSVQPVSNALGPLVSQAKKEARMIPGGFAGRLVRVAAVTLSILVTIASGPLVHAVPSPRAGLPSLVPREMFFPKPPAMQALRLSPDGRLLSYLGPDAAGIAQLWVRALDGGTPRQLTKRPAPGVTGYVWAENGRIVCYEHRESSGQRLVGLELATLRERPLIAIDGAQFGNFVTRPGSADQMLVSMRLPKADDEDIYRIDVTAGTIVLDTKNPGGVPGNQFFADAQLRVRAVQRMTADGSAEVLVRDTVAASWRSWLTADSRYSLAVEAFSGDGEALLIRSDLHSDTERLVSRTLRDGVERDVAGASDLDVERVLLHPRTGAVQAVSFLRDPRQWEALDPAVARDFQGIGKVRRGHLGVVSRDQGDTRWLVAVSTDRAAARWYLWDRATRKATLLLDEQPQLAGLPLVPVEPIAFTARDGLRIHGYLRVPLGVPARNLPLVVWVHGGPYLRDSWGMDLLGQFFVNRGYAFLRVNYRGSRGYGRAFRLASFKQWGLTMQDDVIDAVDYVIGRGVADRSRVAIMGHSYGGYVALAALAQTPDRFVCGAASSTTANLVAFVDRFPRTPGNQWVRNTIGDAQIPAEAAVLRSVSPITHVHRVSKPLLIARGDRDDALPPGDIDTFVGELGKRGQQVTSIVYEGDGHFFRRANELDYYARAEALLARCLGGRAEPMPAGGQPGATGRVKEGPGN